MPGTVLDAGWTTVDMMDEACCLVEQSNIIHPTN